MSSKTPAVEISALLEIDNRASLVLFVNGIDYTLDIDDHILQEYGISLNMETLVELEIMADKELEEVKEPKVIDNRIKAILKLADKYPELAEIVNEFIREEKEYGVEYGLG